MAGWFDLVFDASLCSLYIFLLIRLSTAADKYFKTPFFIFFIATGIYSVITVITYQVVAQFPYTERYWTICFYKPAYALNAAAAQGATFGKATIAIHRYYVLRRRDFSEKKLSRRTIFGILAVQCTVAVVLTASIWPASYVYMNQETMDRLIALSRIHTLIQRTNSVVAYILYIICNGVLGSFTSKELNRLRETLQDKTAASRAILAQQRSMVIIVSVCSLSHLVKAIQQFLLGFLTYFELYEAYNFIWPLYPFVNGLATYAAPFCLVVLSSKVRARLTGKRRIHPKMSMISVEVVVRKHMKHLHNPCIRY